MSFLTTDDAKTLNEKIEEANFIYWLSIAPDAEVEEAKKNSKFPKLVDKYRDKALTVLKMRGIVNANKHARPGNLG